MRHAIGAGDSRQAFTGFTARHRFLSLVWCQLRRAPHMDAASLGARPSLASASTDQLTLELGQAAKHRQHQSAVRRGGIGQASASDLKVAPALAMASRMLSKSRVDRAIRSRRVTMTVLPSPIALSSFAS